MSTGRHERLLEMPRGPVVAPPRPRHEVPPPLLALLRPLFRYSEFRDAYVLRHVAPLVQDVGGEHDVPRRPRDECGRVPPRADRRLERRAVAARVAACEANRVR